MGWWIACWARRMRSMRGLGGSGRRWRVWIGGLWERRRRCRGLMGWLGGLGRRRGGMGLSWGVLSLSVSWCCCILDDTFSEPSWMQGPFWALLVGMGVIWNWVSSATYMYKKQHLSNRCDGQSLSPCHDPPRQSLHSSQQPLPLALFRNPTPSPPDLPRLINQIYISDLPIRDPQLLSHLLPEPPPNHKIPPPQLPLQVLPRIRQEEADQTRFHPILFNIDINLLHPRFLHKPLQFLATGAREKSPTLPFGPRARVYSHDADAAGKHSRRIPDLPCVLQSVTPHIREIERFVRFEQFSWCEERFALGVVHVGPFAEVGLADGCRPEIVKERRINSLSLERLRVRRRIGGRRDGGIQLFPPFKMLIIVEKVIAALAPGAGIYAAVLAWLGRTRLA